MKTNIAAGLLLLIGAIWAGQGYGIIGGSIMTGDSFWLYVGIICMVAGLGLIIYKRVKQPKQDES